MVCGGGQSPGLTKDFADASEPGFGWIELLAGYDWVYLDSASSAEIASSCIAAVQSFKEWRCRGWQNGCDFELCFSHRIGESRVVNFDEPKTWTTDFSDGKKYNRECTRITGIMISNIGKGGNWLEPSRAFQKLPNLDPRHCDS
jgi:hypothetical protein